MKSQRCHLAIRQQAGHGLETNAMRVLIATDAWHPQVNGVVRSLTSLARTAKGLGVDIEFLSPDGFRTFPLPTYPGLRLAMEVFPQETHNSVYAASLTRGLRTVFGRAPDIKLR